MKKLSSSGLALLWKKDRSCFIESFQTNVLRSHHWGDYTSSMESSERKSAKRSTCPLTSKQTTHKRVSKFFNRSNRPKERIDILSILTKLILQSNRWSWKNGQAKTPTWRSIRRTFIRGTVPSLPQCQRSADTPTHKSIRRLSNRRISSTSSRNFTTSLERSRSPSFVIRWQYISRL